MHFQKVVAEIKHGTETREEGKSSVHIELGMVGKESTEQTILECPHMGDYGGEIGIANEKPLEKELLPQTRFPLVQCLREEEDAFLLP